MREGHFELHIYELVAISTGQNSRYPAGEKHRAWLFSKVQLKGDQFTATVLECLPLRDWKTYRSKKRCFLMTVVIVPFGATRCTKVEPARYTLPLASTATPSGVIPEPNFTFEVVPAGDIFAMYGRLESQT